MSEPAASGGFCPFMFAARCYNLLIRAGAWVLPVALLVIRLAWGWELVESGHAHLTHLQDTADFFASIHIPMPRANAIISGCTEMVGGILWMSGLATRLISIPLFFNFCVAYLTASRDKVIHLFQQDPSNFIDDSAFPFLVTSLLLLGAGPGIISIDGLVKSLCCKKSRSPAGDPK
jgi:putative oxidoreductase